MEPFRHILVPTDFGPTSVRAAELACGLAEKLGAKITLLHVWEIPYASYYEGMALPLDRIEESVSSELEREATRLREKFPGTEIRTRIAKDLPWRTILDAVTEIDASCVVLGTHGRRGLPRILLGSVAEKIVRLSPVPVLTIGPEKPKGA